MSVTSLFYRFSPFFSASCCFQAGRSGDVAACCHSCRPPAHRQRSPAGQRNEADESLSEAAVAAIVFAVAACLLPLTVLLAKMCSKYR
jgi:hypothetical protein